MTIYYSHSKSIYNTDRELSELKIISDQNPGIDIINPRDLDIPPEEDKLFRHTIEKYIKPEINKCAVLCYSRDDNDKITSGVNEEIQYQYQRKMAVRPIIRMMNGTERQAFYKKNTNVMRQLLDFFNLKDGYRCMAMRPFDLDIQYVYRDAFSEYNYALRPLMSANFLNSVGYARTIEFMPYIFDEGIFQNNRKVDVENHVIGITLVIDIDSHDVDPKIRDKDGKIAYKGDKSRGRIDILSHQKYIDEMNNIVDEFRYELSKIGFDIDKIIFSGNGVSIMLENYYNDDFQKILQVQDGLNAIKNIVKRKTGCEVHLKRYGWNSNFKPPGTFHFNNFRLTLEIDKLDMDYLVKHSDPFSKVYRKVEYG